MGILIDSSTLIAFEREAVDVEPYIRHREQDEFFVSVITASELLHGAHRADTAKRRAKRLEFVEAVLEMFPVIDIDLAVARVHARLWADLLKKGQKVGLHDSWLAATCLTHDLSLVTGNAREFSRIPGLQVEVWS